MFLCFASDKVKEKDDPESGELTMQYVCLCLLSHMAFAQITWVIYLFTLLTRTKRMSIAVGPSSFASRKKKIKKASANPQNDN